MSIGPHHFGMNFTAVRLREDGRLFVYGDTDEGVGAVEAIEIVAFRPGNARPDDALFMRLDAPELDWSGSFDAPSPYALDDEVYVVGLALRPSDTAPSPWRNLLTVQSYDREVPSPDPPPAGA